MFVPFSLLLSTRHKRNCPRDTNIAILPWCFTQPDLPPSRTMGVDVCLERDNSIFWNACLAEMAESNLKPFGRLEPKLQWSIFKADNQQARCFWVSFWMKAPKPLKRLLFVVYTESGLEFDGFATCLIEFIVYFSLKWAPWFSGIQQWEHFRYRKTKTILCLFANKGYEDEEHWIIFRICV